MTMHAIDTLAAAEMLQEAGLEEKAAKAIVQVFDDGAVAHLATKDDLKEIKHEIANLESRIDTKFAQADTKLETLRTDIAHSKWQLVVAMGVLLGLFKAFDKFF